MGLDWKAIVRGIAPTIGTVISGGNPLAGGALKVLAEQLLGKPDASEDELATWVMGAKPEDLVKLKQIEADYNARMAEIGLRPMELEIQDRSSARDLFKIDTKPQKQITYLFLSGYFAILVGFMVCAISGRKVDLPQEFSIIFGVLSGAVPMILAFWFGSTQSSGQKNALLAASRPPDAS
jgi:hypothetical protein